MLSRARIPDKTSICTVSWQLPLSFDHIKREDLITKQKEEFKSLIELAATDNDYIIYDDILLSVKRPGYEHAHYPRVILPQQWREKVIENRHEQAGHGAFSRILYHVQETYVWPGMCDDIRKILAKCGACKMFHTKKSHVHLGQMPMPHYPHQIVSMDLVGLFPRSKFGHVYLFTLIDHLTGWADVYPIAHKRGETIAEILIKQYFPQYGFPEVTISDNGSEFCNADVTALFGSLGIEHHRTTVYHPQSNGKIERFHRTFKSMLRKLTFRKNPSWETRLGPALVAYRNTVHSSTRFTPFQALYGRVNRLP